MVGYKRKCESFKVFEKNNQRASVLVLRTTHSSPFREHIDELDNFIHELILEIVPTFGGDRAAMHEPLKALVKDDPAIALRVALAGSDEERRDELRFALERWLDTKSFHGVSAVVQGLGYCGVPLVESGLDKNWRTRVEHFTTMRHKIVHRGSAPSLVADNARECVELVGQVATNINGEAVLLYRG